MTSKIPEHLAARFARLLRRGQAPYAWVSRSPAILHVQLSLDTLPEFVDTFSLLFRALRGRSLSLLCCHGGLEETLLEGSLQLSAECAAAFPDVAFYHLCNEEKHVDEWRRQGLRAIHCNHNAFVDERIFRPLESVAKSYSAVYDARLVQVKRHWLAAKVQGLALIHYVVPLADDMEYANQVEKDFAGAHFFNLESGSYQLLGGSAINHCLNQCRAGLCLSEAEGAMYASGQYLLSGLGIVSTPSRGGRDCFWDDESTLTVEPVADAVRDGVEQLLQRQLDPWKVRGRTLALMQIHRQRFFELVQSIWDAHEQSGRFEDEWPSVFFNRLLRNQNHLETLDWLCGAERRP